MVQITWSVAKSPRVAEQCDVNILTQLNPSLLTGRGSLVVKVSDRDRDWYRPRHLTKVQNCEVRHQKPSCSETVRRKYSLTHSEAPVDAQSPPVSLVSQFGEGGASSGAILVT
ncbi:hypothetical protein TNCV_3235811 [Trichonephila clavipes]|nr:hypothetical protein TNCV_3235811 [Trichonephila clavipes]